MKQLQQYINESLDNTIFEGFLDKLKDAIENVVDDPKKYFTAVEKNLKDMKDQTYFRFMNKKDPEAVAKELDNLNNEEDLKKIYKYVKELMKDKDGEIYRSLTSYGDWPEKVLKDVQNNLYNGCDENKAFAVIQIAYTLFVAISAQNKKSSSSHSSSGSSSSRRRAASIGAASAVAIAMRR